MTDSAQMSAYQAHIRKHQTWNFTANFLDLTFFNLAMSFIYGATVLSLYASHLTSSAVLIGLIPAIQSVGFSIPQLLLAHMAERLPRKKPLIMKISVMERLPYLVVGLGILLWPGAPRWLAYLVLSLNLTVATAAGGLAAPAWKAMLAKVVPLQKRGLLFGGSQALGGVLGMAGAAVSSRILDNYPYPISFGICFLFCFVFHALSYVSLTLNREPALEPVKEALPLKDYWHNLPNVLKGNPNFVRYLVGRALIALGGMGAFFYIVYARRAFGATDAFAGNLTIAALFSVTACTPLLGALADRLGHKWLTELCTLIAAAAGVLTLIAPSLGWLYAVFMLMSAASAGMMVANTSMTMEFSTLDDLPTFTALADTLLTVPVLLAPILGGWLVDWLGFQVMFVAALLLSLMGWAAMRWGVREPRLEQREIALES